MYIRVLQVYNIFLHLGFRDGFANSNVVRCIVLNGNYSGVCFNLTFTN